MQSRDHKGQMRHHGMARGEQGAGQAECLTFLPLILRQNKVRHDAAGDGFGMFPENQQQRDREKVLDAVVEDDWMPESLGIGKLHRPGDSGYAFHDLPVDKVADAADFHQKRPGNDQLVHDPQKAQPSVVMP
jgi:hypothetical protein